MTRRKTNGIEAAVFGAAGLTALALAQSPAITSVVNAANGNHVIASGSRITIWGTNLATMTRAWDSADFHNGRLPLSLDGVSVKVNNLDAPVSYISPTQVNALAPADTTNGLVVVELTNAAGAGALTGVSHSAYAPALFAFPYQDYSYAVAVHTPGATSGTMTWIDSRIEGASAVILTLTAQDGRVSDALRAGI
jgi:uncharacterized protein (TIGR03437 family)